MLAKKVPFDKRVQVNRSGKVQRESYYIILCTYVLILIPVNLCDFYRFNDYEDISHETELNENWSHISSHNLKSRSRTYKAQKVVDSTIKQNHKESVGLPEELKKRHHFLKVGGENVNVFSLLIVHLLLTTAAHTEENSKG